MQQAIEFEILKFSRVQASRIKILEFIKFMQIKISGSLTEFIKHRRKKVKRVGISSKLLGIIDIKKV